MLKDDEKLMVSAVGEALTETLERYENQLRVGGRWQVSRTKVPPAPDEKVRETWVITTIIGELFELASEVRPLWSQAGPGLRRMSRQELIDGYEPVPEPCTRCTAPMPHVHTGRVVVVRSRTHDADWSGQVLREGDWKHLELAPAEWGGLKSKLGEPERKTPCTRFSQTHEGPHPDFPGYCRRCGHPLKTLSPFRFTLQVERLVGAEHREEVLAEHHGAVFRGARVSYNLGLQEVADGWRVSPVLLGELERGLLRFKAPADLSAALSQLWCWAVEKNPEIAR